MPDLIPTFHPVCLKILIATKGIRDTDDSKVEGNGKGLTPMSTRRIITASKEDVGDVLQQAVSDGERVERTQSGADGAKDTATAGRR